MSSQEEITSGGISSPESDKSKDIFLEPKPQKKIIRILTVLAYVLSVSMAAILLSIYYIFMWHGQPHLGAHQAYELINTSNNPSKIIQIVHNNNSNEEMQQQQIPFSAQTTSTTEENTTWMDYDTNPELDGFQVKNNFIKKLMYNKYYEKK